VTANSKKTKIFFFPRIQKSYSSKEPPKKQNCSQTLQLLQMQLMCNTHVWAKRLLFMVSSPLVVPPMQERSGKRYQIM
jgi:hypothetical protein